MKKRYEYGGEIDAMEAINYSDEARDIAESVGTGARNMDVPKAKPKAAPKPAAKAAARDTGSDVARMANRGKPAAAAADDTKMSVADRAKASRERARAGSGTTDTRSVGERLRSAFAGKNRGGNSVDFGGTGLGMKSGGSVGSASRRADGIATKGKTRGKMC
jgi:uncharacterized membrane protein